MGRDGQRRLSAIVFTDIVGYSAVVHRDEALGAQLLDRQRQVVRRIVPQHGGREVETAGDSFLLEFGSALAAVQAVLAIQRQLAADNASAPAGERVVLRASVHLGDVEHRGREVFGDGVNTAARLLPHSPPGGMAISAAVFGMVRQRLRLAAKSIGTPALKNIETPVEVLTVGAGELAGPATLAPLRAAWRPMARWLPAGFVAALALLALFAAARWLGPAPPADKSVAVLPFANMSSEKDSQYFSDGMQDEILTALAKIRDLKVIARTSVEKYRDRHDDVRVIARELDVATVMEGGVQRAGNRVRINVQLIDASSGAHLWAERYDRELTDVFALQSEIAREVAQALKATLLPAEASALAAAPTQNDRAYDLYLQAASVQRKVLDEYALASRLMPQVIALLQQALDEDPAFALAHATLALAHMYTYWFAGETGPERLAAARTAADRALALRPDSGEAELALGLHAYWGRYDYGAATEHLRRAAEVLPNDPNVAVIQAAVLRRQGRFEEALASFLRYATLNPQSPSPWSELANTYFQLRRDADCKAAADRAVAVSGNALGARVDRAWWALQIDGDLQPMRAAVGAIEPGSDEFRDQALNVYMLHWSSREFAAAARTAEAMPERIFWMFGTAAMPTALLAAQAYDFDGQKALARARYAEAAALIDAALKRQPDDPGLLMFRASAYAGLGRRAEALAAVERAAALMPTGKDALNGPVYLYALAQLHAWVGDPERSLEILGPLLGHGRMVGPGGVRLDPFFDRVRADPRFAALVKS